jgi:hypothetical protein
MGGAGEATLGDCSWDPVDAARVAVSQRLMPRGGADRCSPGDGRAATPTPLDASSSGSNLEGMVPADDDATKTVGSCRAQPIGSLHSVGERASHGNVTTTSVRW